MSARASRLSSRSGGAVWYPVIDSIGILMIIVAFFTFLYFAVGYRYLPLFYQPATLMAVMLASGLSLGITLVGARVEHNLVSLTAATAGILAGLGLLAVQMVVGVAGIPAQGVSVIVSPFWIVMLYASVGVAEEAAFTLFMFGSLIRGGINPFIATAIKSVFFVAYHNFVAIQMFGEPIFKVTNYSLVLYIGSAVLTLAFYYTRIFSVPALGHALLNAYWQIRTLAGGV